MPRRYAKVLALAAGLGFAIVSRPSADSGGVVPASLPVPMPTGTPDARPDCPLCVLDAGVPLVHLRARDIDSLGTAYSAHNEAEIVRIDSLFRSGALGPPESARRSAHLLARLRTWNAYTYVARYATDPDFVYEASESTLTPAFRRYSDPGLYPIVRLERARMGRGRVCLRYDLERDLDTTSQMGAKSVRVRTRTLDLGGRRRRVLSMDLATGLDDHVEILMSSHYTCSVEEVRREDLPGAYDLVVLDDIEGGWLRKWGTHHPQALVFWVTRRTAPELPPPALVGVRIYVPRLRLKLPSLLPDIGFEDLREIDLPQPILSLESLRRGALPEWLTVTRAPALEGWVGHGPLPEELRQRFPDL